MTYRMEQKEEIRIVGIRTPMTEDMEGKPEKHSWILGEIPEK